MKVAIIFGGASSEYDISRRSVMNFIENIDKKHEKVLIGINKKGQFKIHLGDKAEIVDDTWEENSENIVFSNDPEKKGIYIIEGSVFEFISIDVVIPVLHGQNGEDGVLQGLLELTGIPYVGWPVLASAVGFDKYTAKLVVNNTGIRQARCTFVSGQNFDINLTIKKVKKENLGLPLFVKPCGTGSSIGVTKVERLEDLEYAIREALNYDDRVLIEEAIIGREVECAVLGNENPEISVVGEIRSEHDFYDFHSKYESTVSETVTRADIDEATSEKIRKSAAEIYSILNCRGLSRVDFFIEKKTGDVVFNEINTFPGFTSISMYPMLFKEAGYTATALIERLIDLAVQDA